MSRPRAIAIGLPFHGARFDSDVELAMNQIGYDYLSEDDTSMAVQVLMLNAELFPQSANVHDSLGDGLKAAGNRDAAALSYRRALEIDPTFESSRRSLRELQADP